jgi:hypothetical protein
MGLGRVDKLQTTHMDLHKTNTRWLVHSWSTFGAKMSHGATQTHKTHHGSDLGEATTFPLIIYSTPLHGGHIQMAFCPGTPIWESQNFQAWVSHNFGAHNFLYKPSIDMRSIAKL